MDFALVIHILVSGVPGLFIALFAKEKLEKSGNKYATWISLATFIASSLLIFFVIFWLIIHSIRFER
jgi:uncharacterized membrane protein